MDTPVSLFKKVAARRFSYLLESVEGGEQLGRYSIIGYDPFLVFRARGKYVEIEQNGAVLRSEGDPLKSLKKCLDGLRVGPVLPEPRFFGGAVGYIGYDLVRCYEALPDLVKDDLGLPDCYFLLARVVLIYDHVRNSLRITAFVPHEGNPLKSYEEASELIAGIRQRIRSGMPDRGSFFMSSPTGSCLSDLQPNMERQKFLDKVRRVKSYIEDGDVFQVVLSQRFQCSLDADSFDVYRALRATNPSPYMYYLDFGDFQIVGSSPEMLLRVEKGYAETHPIAGTRPRGADPLSDEALAREMITDSKERAEHVMLVDLGRNDLGRVCEYGTVEVARFMEIERYSHVMHLVSTVKGKLASGCDSLDALVACFPAGTVSGAPKIRAMQIIEELEPLRRGPYAGAVGYLSFNGSLDSCITIRTVLIKGGRAYIQAGAGIVADSDPEKEYEETFNKARAMFGALQLAIGGREDAYQADDRKNSGSPSTYRK